MHDEVVTAKALRLGIIRQIMYCWSISSRLSRLQQIHRPSNHQDGFNPNLERGLVEDRLSLSSSGRMWPSEGGDGFPRSVVLLVRRMVLLVPLATGFSGRRAPRDVITLEQGEMTAHSARHNAALTFST